MGPPLTLSAAQQLARVCSKDCSGCPKTSRAPRRRIIRYNSARAMSGLCAVCWPTRSRGSFITGSLFSLPCLSHCSLFVSSVVSISCIIRCIGLVQLSLLDSFIRRFASSPRVTIRMPNMRYVDFSLTCSFRLKTGQRPTTEPPTPTRRDLPAAAVHPPKGQSQQHPPPCLFVLYSVFPSILV
jgi:hypothetical protein